MKFTFRRGLAAAAAATLTIGAAVTTSTAAHAAEDDSDELVMYVTNWDAIDTLKRLDESGAADEITTINYAFGDVAPRDLSREEASGHPDFPETGLGMDWEDYDEDEHGPIVCKPVEAEDEFFRTFSADESISGEEEEGGLIRQLELLKEEHPQIKVLPSLGGATLSKWFSVATQTEETRETLIDSCVDLWINGNYTDEDEGPADNFAGVFDGVDLDWEFPAFVDADGNPEDRSGNELSISADDAENYTKLAAEFRPALEDALGGETWVTAATPASGWTGSGFDFPSLAEELDWYSVMAYDLHGTWESEVGYGAGIEDKEWGVVDTLAMYLDDNAVDPSKIVLGVPFYGPSWGNVEPNDDGTFFQEEEDEWGGMADVGVDGDADRDYNWREIRELIENECLQIEWDEEYQASYIYDEDGHKFYSFDSPRALQTKVRDLVHGNDLRGVMAWEFDADTDDAELTKLLSDELANPTEEAPEADANVDPAQCEVDQGEDDNDSDDDDDSSSNDDDSSSSSKDDEEAAGAVTLEPSYTG